VRIPEEMPTRQRPSHHRRRVVLVVVLAVLVAILASLHSLAAVYTDALWFGSVHLASVWHRLFDVKLGLFVVFGAIFFVLLFVNLTVVGRLAPSELSLRPEEEVVRRFRQTVAPRALLLRVVLSLLGAAIAGASAIGEWENYLLFRYGVRWGVRDPQFHKDIGFFVFRLPFLSFLVDWAFVSLLVVTILCLIAHYLTGGVRLQREPPRVAPAVKVHLSVLLAAIALVKAAGYVVARYQLDTSTNGYVQGAGYTDVHARLPALELLVWVSLAAAVVLLVNVRLRGWLMPVLAVGTWAVVALTAGAIYPALLQALKVNPAQSSLERPYIARNIAATRAAFGLNGVRQVAFAADQQVTPAELQADSQSLADVSVWDPSQTSQTFTKEQQTRGYYSFNTLAVDRYDVNGVLTPVVVGVRQVNDASLPASGWVTTHLQYTHGYGMIVALANESTSASASTSSGGSGSGSGSSSANGSGTAGVSGITAASGQPVFALANVPEQSTDGLPAITQPDVYYGVANSNGSDASFVIGDTKEPEVDASTNGGVHYAGTGGVRLDNLLTRAAFAIRFSDLNVLISNLITAKSRLLFHRDILSAIKTAAPFLSLDSSPYPVIVNGQIDWVEDAYTTTDQYPYSQDADTAILPPSSGLPASLNYARASVVVVTNAYSGQMTFYVTDPSDPIIRTWERVFPHMFTPASKMPPALVAHLRYPQDLFMLQAQTYGRYHLTNPLAFYDAANAWTLSQDPGSGSPTALAQTIYTENAQGQLVSTGQTQRMTPQYEVVALPGHHQPSFTLLDALVPYSSDNSVQTLAGFMTASSKLATFGQLTDYVTPPGQDVDGPALVEGRIQENTDVSSQISLLNRDGSSVELGNVIMVPVDQSILYFRPLYVQASRNAVPELAYVIAVYSGVGGSGTQVAMATSLQAAIAQIFAGVTLPVPGASTPVVVSPSAPADQQVQNLIQQAVADEQAAQNDLRNLDYAQYGVDESNLQQVLAQLQAAANAGPSSSSSNAGASSSGTATGQSGAGGAPSSSAGSSATGSSGGSSRPAPQTSGGSGAGSGGSSSNGSVPENEASAIRRGRR
jgi:uncharacterized membrane protein (UPF0182 family)